MNRMDGASLGISTGPVEWFVVSTFDEDRLMILLLMMMLLLLLMMMMMTTNFSWLKSVLNKHLDGLRALQ